MKKLLTMLLLMAVSFPMHGVLNERNLPQTLSVLNIELQKTYNDQKVLTERLTKMSEEQHTRLVNIMQQCNQISLMLYSQKQDYTFDMTYACHEATNLYREFNRKRMPYEEITSRLQHEIERYDGLLNALRSLPPSLVLKQDTLHLNSLISATDTVSDGSPYMLTPEQQEERKACIEHAMAIRKLVQQMYESIAEDSEHYDRISARLKQMNDYATERYHNIQQNIFINGGQNYFTQILSLRRAIRQAKQDVADKYSDKGYADVRSEWRGPIVFGLIIFVVFYLVVATVISYAITSIFMRKVKRLQTDEFKKKRLCIILAGIVLIFALSIMIVRSFMWNNFLIMASALLVEFAWLTGAILLSLLIRLNGDQIRSGFRIYTPIMLMGFIIIVFRIIFIPNRLVSLIFPPILLIFSLWQWSVIRRQHANVPRSDTSYTFISLAVMVVSCILAWSGYVLLSVQLFIWWLFQLTAIQTITCVYDLLQAYKNRFLQKRIDDYGKRHGLSKEAMKQGEYIKVTWLYDLVTMALVPVASVLSILLSIYWAADVFDLSDTCVTIFFKPYINFPGVLQLSLFKIVLVLSMYFIFKYISYALKALYRTYRLTNMKRRSGSGYIPANKSNFTLANNLISILVWGLYVLFSIQLLNVPKSGISVVTAGLATGVGFAMKDLLENFFYGIQLMAGRVRVGDIIECDGIRGKVDSITYQSTQVATADGSIIAFLNNQLFTKNFKNLTRNHSYELTKIPVGVAYGVNVSEVRKLILEALQQLLGKDRYGREVISTARGINVYFDDFGDNSVNLYVMFWALVDEKFTVMWRAKELIYNTLNEHHIEIPFPQRDVYIRQLPTVQTEEIQENP